LPKSWAADPGLCRQASIPEGTAFATKPALARGMLARTLDAGVPAGRVTGDEVYGADPDLRAGLEHRQMGYVLAVACHHRVSAGTRQRADALARPSAVTG
jgi:SRSO17 transposase